MELSGLIVAFIPVLAAFIGMTVEIVKSHKECKRMRAQLKAFSR